MPIINQKEFVSLFSNCIPVNGYLRSIIYDIQRGNYHFVPHELVLFIQKIEGKNLFDKSIIKTLENEQNKEYLDFLIEHELAFYCDISDVTLFNKIDLSYESPELINKLDVSLGYQTNISFLTDIINELNISILNVRLNYSTHKQVLNNLLDSIRFSTLKNINIYLSDNVFHEDVLNYFKQEKRIGVIFLQNNLSQNIDSVYLGKLFTYSQFNNQSTILPASFIIETTLFIESQTLNPSYNKSLFIDEKGKISNSPLFNEYYEKLDNLTLENIKQKISTPSFQKYWHIHKNLIDVCKHCEFKYMCLDSRIPKKRNDKEWYHETECNYNPYIAKWKDEEGYRTLNECGIQSNAKEFNINKKQLNKINYVLWEDE